MPNKKSLKYLLEHKSLTEVRYEVVSGSKKEKIEDWNLEVQEYFKKGDKNFVFIIKPFI